ncbi:hypothetical protein PACTADRAFT_51933 [Pachysolen tannophilus NRRL Y-2460]|uniref:K Homology domain-containing protein n=1 Tax=Pachysolen tannophilus NRRL Y-2460 TaxID=669874 RepID=A0A1E4TNL7_PACTA|nr:hypothetical protein PACTADRAFT_51933 [Pachysolen tannophilus NRRL Y-2460]
MLKRKNDEVDEENGAKRVALDSEAIERHDKEEDSAKTAAVASTTSNEDVTMANTNNNNNNNNYNNNSDETGSAGSINNRAGPISSHKVDDPTYVHFRMFCPVKEASLIVGKGGEKISHIKEAASCRINVSDNLRGVPERIVSVRGPAENVAKAFGFIVRAIVDEPENVPSSPDSKPFMMKLLFPHPIMGYIIGKKGARFREIEENSAARLKAEDRTLPQSTDRILNLTGVADAIHIATYYIAQTVLENKQLMSKCVFYNPANYSLNVPFNPMLNGGNPMIPGMPMSLPMQIPPMMNMMGANPMAAAAGSFNNAPRNNGTVGGRQFNNTSVNNGMPFIPRTQQAQQQNNFNTLQQGERIEQDYAVPKEHIGLVIGKGGSNVKHIRQLTGCYVKINDEIQGSPSRVLTLQGTQNAINAAIQLISNKVEHEKKKITEAQHQQQLPPQQQQENQHPDQIVNSVSATAEGEEQQEQKD